MLKMSINRYINSINNIKFIIDIMVCSKWNIVVRVVLLVNLYVIKIYLYVYIY